MDLLLAIVIILTSPFWLVIGIVACCFICALAIFVLVALAYIAGGIVSLIADGVSGFFNLFRRRK